MPRNQDTDTGTDTSPVPPEDQMNQSEETWAQQIYKLWGEKLPTWAQAFGEVYDAEREREQEELAQAIARLDEHDLYLAERDARRDAAAVMTFDDTDRVFELKDEMKLLENNPLEMIDMPDAPDTTFGSVISDQIAAFRLQKEELFLEVQVFKGLEDEKMAFTTANELVGMLLDKAFIQSGVYNFAACEMTLAEVERKLKDMKNLLLDAQVHPATYVSSEDQVLIAQDVKKVKEIIFDMQDIGYTGLGTILLIEMNQYQDAVLRPEDPRWKELLSDAEACKKLCPSYAAQPSILRPCARA